MTRPLRDTCVEDEGAGGEEAAGEEKKWSQKSPSDTDTQVTERIIT